ncbi:MAG: class F sortase [Acidimicrobiales bacterium]|nr:class F sortase [Acidimicrobiales bacterium]
MRSIPLFIDIPSINVSANLTQLGLNPDGTVQVPSSWYVPGWYRFGATPGQQGSAVILGHVDSVQGPAVFYSISQLKQGDIVSVGLSDGIVAHFSVTNVEMFQKSNFPDSSVYGNNGSSDLNLVTCGGAFDYQSHHYLSNVVVYTTYVGSSSGK